ncbi:MAG: hypothetical protein KIS85_08385 [Anaerolineales bacterium]|nr:hypothetical protein [Anaerolineales bacterium]
MLISVLALFALAFAFRLEVTSPYFTMRFGPQWPQGVELSANPVDAPRAGSSAEGAETGVGFSFGGLFKTSTGSDSSGSDGVQIGVEAGDLLGVDASLGGDGLQIGADVGNGLLGVDASAGGGEGVQLGVDTGLGVGADASVGGGDGVQLGVDTGLGIGADVGVDPDDGINVNLDLPGDDLDTGVNLGSGGCTLWLLGKCILP